MKAEKRNEFWSQQQRDVIVQMPHLYRLQNAIFYPRILLVLHQFQSLSVNQSEPFKQYIYTPISIGVFCFLKLTICTHRGPTNFSAMKMVTTVKITEFKERNLSTDLICLAQLVQGGGCSYHSPVPRYIRLYQRYKIEVLHPNKGSNRL